LRFSSLAQPARAKRGQRPADFNLQPWIRALRVHPWPLFVVSEDSSTVALAAAWFAVPATAVRV